jgi:hypothetical protein
VCCDDAVTIGTGVLTRDCPCRVLWCCAVLQVENSADTQRVLEQRLARAESLLSDEKSSSARALSALRKQCESELETVHARVKALVAKKNLEAAQLKERLDEANARLKQTELTLAAAKRQLNEL